MRSTLAAICALALGLSLVACRGGGNGDDDDDDVDSGPGGVSIQDVQSDTMAPGTPVELHGVVVVAIDTFGMRTGDIYVMEPEGGEFSGVHVFGAPVDKVAALSVGDIISILGAEKDEFALTSDTSGRTVTELKPVTGGMMDIVKSGTGSVPAPKVVDALAIGQLLTVEARSAEWEKWEGVLITVENVSALNAPACVGSACTDPMLKKFDVTGDIVPETALADFPAGIMRDDCLASVTGIVDYFFDYLIYNRTAGDVVTGGSGCPAKETGDAACGDGMDNDGNSFADCDDFSCQQSATACSTATTVAAVQDGTATGTVMLAEKFVTARDDIPSGKGIWIADSLTAAERNGIFVYAGTAGADVLATVGSTVTVIGTVVEFDVGNPKVGDTLTEITNSNITFVTAAAAPPVPAVVAAGTLSNIDTGEAWEGVLVQVALAKVTNPNVGQGKVELTDNAGGKIVLDDDSFAFGMPALGTCYTTVTGVMSVQLTDNIRTLNPRAATDLVTGTGCTALSGSRARR